MLWEVSVSPDTLMDTKRTSDFLTRLSARRFPCGLGGLGSHRAVALDRGVLMQHGEF